MCATSSSPPIWITMDSGRTGHGQDSGIQIVPHFFINPIARNRNNYATSNRKLYLYFMKFVYRMKIYQGISPFRMYSLYSILKSRAIVVMLLLLSMCARVFSEKSPCVCVFYIFVLIFFNFLREITPNWRRVQNAII